VSTKGSVDSADAMPASKASKRKDKSSGKRAADADDALSAAASGSADWPSPSVLSKKVSELLQNDPPTELVTDVCHVIAPKLQEAHRIALQAIIEPVAGDRKRLEKDFDEQAKDAWEWLLVLSKAVSSFPAAAAESLSQHLLRTIGLPFATMIARRSAWHADVELKSSLPGALKVPLTPEERKSLLQSLPKAISAAVQRLLDSANGKNVDAFVHDVEEACSALDLFFRPVDRKREKCVARCRLCLAHKPPAGRARLSTERHCVHSLVAPRTRRKCYSLCAWCCFRTSWDRR
jgi:hypothetical protein